MDFLYYICFSILLFNYYIDRCELWGFIREINCENISFFLPELLLHNYKCSGYVPCCVTVSEYTYDCKLKKFREMSLTTLAHNQHDIIDVIWSFPVWNIKIIRYHPHTCDRVAMLQLEICKFLAGDLVS
jgi:hypothetical protein